MRALWKIEIDLLIIVSILMLREFTEFDFVLIRVRSILMKVLAVRVSAISIFFLVFALLC